MNKLKVCNALLLATLASLMPLSVKAQPTPNRTVMTVMVDGLRQTSGQVCLRVHATEEGFPESVKGLAQSGCAEITRNSAIKTFYGLKSGTYAVSLYEDKNSDGKLNTNFIGIPSEGFGVSNNPQVKNRLPKFEEASFNLRQNKTINITVQYLFR